MKTQPDQSSHEVLAGLVERVTFHNSENGFCVLRIKARGHRELITVIGYAAVISAGEWLTASGEWVNDRTHGQQYKARFLKTSAPTFAWFRRMQRLHFSHHRHADSNFAVIDFFWDRVLGTYRSPDA